MIKLTKEQGDFLSQVNCLMYLGVSADEMEKAIDEILSMVDIHEANEMKSTFSTFKEALGKAIDKYKSQIEFVATEEETLE